LNPTKLPAIPDPAVNPMDLARSFTFSVISTVLDCVLRLMSAASPSLSTFEVTELVSGAAGSAPTAGVENIAFIEEDLARITLSTRSSIAREVDAPHENVCPLGRQRQIDLIAVGGCVEAGSSPRDVAELAVQLRRFSNPLRSLAVENMSPSRHLEQRLHQRIGSAEQFHAGESNSC